MKTDIQQNALESSSTSFQLNLFDVWHNKQYYGMNIHHLTCSIYVFNLYSNDTFELNTRVQLWQVYQQMKESKIYSSAL